MKLPGYEFPRSSFLSLEKDYEILIQKILANNNIKKLLYYQDKNCLSLPTLDEKQTLELINNQIKIVPKLEIDTDLFSYLLVRFDNFVANPTNPEYRDNVVEFDIICHYKDWNIGNFKQRPYVIAGELDSMFNNARLTGIGTLNFIGANQLILTDELGGIGLYYSAIHQDDKQAQN